MNVAGLRLALSQLPNDMLIGAEDHNGLVCEIQFAGIITSKKSIHYFLIRAESGLYLDSDDPELYTSLEG